jgi:copper chaperone CopZ
MKEERLAAGGALVAAFAASLCCIGPLVFALLGLGTFGAASLIGVARPYLFGVSLLALGFGFYLAYFRRERKCVPGEACATNPVSRTGRAGLWIATVAIIGFAFSPYYARALASRFMNVNASSAMQNEQRRRAQTTFKVCGMTCAGCELTIKIALERTPGVRRAEVSYERGEAAVEYDPGIVTPEKLRSVINETGYVCQTPK